MIQATRCLLALAMVGLASCNHALRPSGFLGKDDARLRPNEDLAFQRSWKNPAADFQKYRTVVVLPMSMDHLLRLEHGLDAASLRNFGDRHHLDCKRLAAYATCEFRDTITASPSKQALITREIPAEPGTLLLETALVEAVPGRPSAQILNFMVPFTALLNRPAVGIEGRVRDAVTGETLFAFSDREVPEISLLDARKFTFYAAQERDVDRWAVQIRDILEGKQRQPRKDPFFIQLINW
ncbi:MAG: DUF3313 family protein [Verrucomicrobiota bacterium]